MDKSFGGVTFSLDLSFDMSSLLTIGDLSFSKDTCKTTAEVVKYSKALANENINPYYYDSADTCRKV